MSTQKSSEKITQYSNSLGVAASIREFRQKLECNQRDFAVLLGVTQGAVAHWETGKTKPTPMALMAIGNLGGADRGYWYRQAGQNYSETDELVIHYKKANPDWDLDASGTRRIPLLKEATDVGTSRVVDQDQVERMLFLPPDWLPAGGKLVALKIVGDSMSPVLEADFVVIVDINRRDPKHLVNRLVAAKDHDGITIRYLQRDLGLYLLVPKSPSKRNPVRQLNMADGFGIVGEVVKWIGQPKSSGL